MTAYTGELVIEEWRRETTGAYSLKARISVGSSVAPAWGDTYDVRLVDPNNLYTQGTNGSKFEVLFPGFTDAADITWTSDGDYPGTVLPHHLVEGVTYRLTTVTTPPSAGGFWYGGSVTMKRSAVAVGPTGPTGATGATGATGGTTGPTSTRDFTQFFAGPTEITELYAGTSKVWSKMVARAGHWIVQGATTSMHIPDIDGYTAGTFQVQMDPAPMTIGSPDYILGKPSPALTTNAVATLGALGSAAVNFHVTLNPDAHITSRQAVDKWGGQLVEITVNNARNIMSIRVVGTSRYEAAVRALAPRAFWPLELDGQDVVGTYHLTGTYVHAPKALYSGADGAAAFNSTGAQNLLDAHEHALVAPGLGLSATPAVWTVCAWVAPRKSAIGLGLFGNLPYMRYASTAGSWSLETIANDSLGVKYQRDATSIATIQSTTRYGPLPPGTNGAVPVFVVVSDGNFWVNGVKASSPRPTLKMDHNSMAVFSIGATEASSQLPATDNGYLRGYSGEIAGVALFNKVLTQAEIDTLYQSGRAA